MQSPTVRRSRIWIPLGVLLATAVPAPAQGPHATLADGQRCWPSYAPPACATPVPPAYPVPPATPTTPPGAEAPPEAPAEQPALPELAAGVGGGRGLAFSSPGAYLDDAIPRTMFRLRYDAGFDLNRPDRAEYFYAAWKELSFHQHAIEGKSGAFFDPKARGPVQLVDKLDYQDVSAYLEYAFTKRFSLFVDIPTRFVDFRNVINDDPGSVARGVSRFRFFEPRPENPDEDTPVHFSGLSDVEAGFKLALIAEPDEYLTFQLRAYAPSGSAQHGLGTGHPSLEPGLLGYCRLADGLMLQGEFKAWVPIAGGPMQGNILIYGVGAGYDLFHRGELHVVPVTEFVGWTVLDGFETVFGPVGDGVHFPKNHGVASAAGDTIVNGKVGVRTYYGAHDLYVGWGHALTGERWYKDIFRLEYRYAF